MSSSGPQQRLRLILPAGPVDPADPEFPVRFTAAAAFVASILTRPQASSPAATPARYSERAAEEQVVSLVAVVVEAAGDVQRT